MTLDPFGAVLDELAALSERITETDMREAAHFGELRGQLAQLTAMVATVSRSLAEDTAALARLDELGRQVAELAAQCGGRTERDCGGYQPSPAPAWHKLAADQRQVPVMQLRDWVEHVYRPGYGHLAELGACWPEHDLCLYALDVLSQLWCVLYLQPARTAALLSAQAEYQLRILPTIAAQLAEETTHCGHAAATPYPGARP